MVAARDGLFKFFRSERSWGKNLIFVVGEGGGAFLLRRVLQEAP